MQNKDGIGKEETADTNLVCERNNRKIGDRLMLQEERG